MDVEVDLEGLRPVALLGQHAAEADDREPAQLDDSGRHGCGQAPLAPGIDATVATSSRPSGPELAGRAAAR